MDKKDVKYLRKLVSLSSTSFLFDVDRINIQFYFFFTQ